MAVIVCGKDTIIIKVRNINDFFVQGRMVMEQEQDYTSSSNNTLAIPCP